MGSSPKKPVKETGKKQRRVGDGTPGPGRPKGLPNKTTSLLKDAILMAARIAGDGYRENSASAAVKDPAQPDRLKGVEDGLVAYLVVQAQLEPKAFVPLLGKVLPMQISNEDGGPLTITIENHYEK